MKMTINEAAYMLTAYEKFGCVDRANLLHLISVEELEPSIETYNEWLVEHNDMPWVSFDELEDYLTGLSPLEILKIGRFSNYSMVDDLFSFDVYGHIISATDTKIISEARQNKEYLIWLAESENAVTDEEYQQTYAQCMQLLAAGY